MRLISTVQRELPATICRIGGFLLLAAATGCGQNGVQVYKVAKETPQPEAAAQPPPMASAQPDTQASAPGLQWKQPSNWEQVPPGEMRLASFRVAGKDGKTADISVVPLGGMGGSDLGNVNRWRGQVGLPAVSEADLPKMSHAIEIGGQTGQLYELAGTNPGSGDATRMLVGVVRREGTAWFFKMVVDDRLVSQQKPVFVAFLNSTTFTAGQSELPPSHPPLTGGGQAGLPPSHPPIGDAGQMPAPTASAMDPDRPVWQVPSGWNEVPGGQFLVAKFTLSGPNNAQAAVNVSRSAGDGGGLLANVNRWRGQLGLAPAADMDSLPQVKTLAAGGSQATLVEMSGTDARTGQPARVVAAIVPQGGQTWFYKLMGSDQVVAREKDAFAKFVQSAKYPGGS